jgi:hypothetical protein
MQSWQPAELHIQFVSAQLTQMGARLNNMGEIDVCIEVTRNFKRHFGLSDDSPVPPGEVRWQVSSW